MRLRLRQIYDKVTASLWFIPSVMALGAMLFAVFVVSVDERMTAEQVKDLHFIFKASPDGARSVLSTIAGAIITVAGVVFSITVVALTLASQQFGPRLLRNFMQDRTNQATIGVFVGTFLYCLLVLGTVRGQDSFSFVPNLGVTGALLFTIISLGVLVIYVHHTAASINVSHTVEVVWQQLKDSIDHLFPEDLGQGNEGGTTVERKLGEDCQSAHATASGYVQAIDTSRVMHIAGKEDLVIEFLIRPGHFVVEGQPMARINRRGDKAATDVANAVTIGSHRTPLEDPLFLIDQLVEIALRALSPGINDPFTAFSCIDYLGAAMSRLARRKSPSPERADGDGKVRVVAWGENFESAMNAAFNQIRHAAAGMPAVLGRLIAALDSIVANITLHEYWSVLSLHVSHVRTTVAAIDNTDERRALESGLEKLEARISKAAIGGITKW